MSVAPQILRYLRGRQDAMLHLLERLSMVESPSHEGVAQAPAFAVFAEALWELGFITLQLPGRLSGGQLYARPRERLHGRPIQLLVGHIDTVWPLGTLSKMPVRMDHDRVQGPGVYDMKGGLTQIVFALEALKVLGLETPVIPLVFVNSDEEIGSVESTNRIRRLARIANRAYVLEPSLGWDGRIMTARKGIGRFTLTIREAAAGEGLPPAQRLTTVQELSQQVQKLFTLNDPDAGVTIDVVTIDGGLRHDSGVPVSRCVFDVRVSSREAAAKAEEMIHALTPTTSGMRLEVEGGFLRPPMERSRRVRLLWDMAHTIGLELGLDLQQSRAGDGSDANTTSHYTATLDGLGAVGSGAHTRHEFLFVDKLVERAALLAMLILAPPLNPMR